MRGDYIAFWRDSRIEGDALFLFFHAKKLLKTHVAVWTLGAQHDHNKHASKLEGDCCCSLLREQVRPRLSANRVRLAAPARIIKSRKGTRRALTQHD